MKKFVSVFLIALVQSCAYAQQSTMPEQSELPSSAATTQIAASQSRIRLFGQNGFGVTLYKSSQCGGPMERIRVSGGIKQAFSSMIGAVSNETIGIPETVTTRNLKERNGVLSKAYYKEFSVASGMPVVINMTFQDLGDRCKMLSRRFVPEPGTDYEARLDVAGGTCELLVQQLTAAGELIPIGGAAEQASSSQCSKDE